MDKCEHGVYRAGEPVARYCGLCTAESLNDKLLAGAPKKRLKYDGDTRSTMYNEIELDCTQFMALDGNTRIAANYLGE